MNEIAKPSSALAPLDDLEALLPELPTAKERKELGKALATACQKIREIEGAAAGLDEVAALLTVCGDTITEERVEVLTCLDRITAMAREFIAAASYEELDHVRFTVAKLPGELKTLETAAGRAWRTNVRSRLAGMTPLGDVLARIPQMASLGHQFRTLGRDASTLEQSNAPAVQRIARLQHLLSQRDTLMNDLSGMGIDAEVVSFLQDIASGLLPLSRLTDPIREWLDRVGATDVFRVGLA